MSDLVPEEAIAAARDAVGARYEADAESDDSQIATAALAAAAPLILAAELDQLADTLAADAEANPHGGYYDGMSEAAGIVRDRASVLRGEGDPK